MLKRSRQYWLSEMTSQYLAVVQGTAYTTYETLASRLKLAVQVKLPGFALMADEGSHAIPSADGRHVLIGNLFSRGLPSKRVTILPDGEPGFVERALIERHWGSYIGFLCDTGAGCIQILRDPSGFLPCYYTIDNKTVFLASDPDLLLRATQRPAEIDFEYIHSYLAFSDQSSARTGLKNVMELNPGCSLLAAYGKTEQKLSWRPSSFANAEMPVAMPEISDLLRATIDDCVRCWSKTYPRAILTLSGGLDSSVVASALARALPSKLICVTGYTNDMAGDERRYARIMARAIDTPLLEFRHEAAAIDIHSLSGIHGARPVQRLSGQAFDGYLDACSRKYGANVIFDGFGGDNVFCLMRSGAPLADHWLATGLSAELALTIRNIGHLTNASIPNIIGSARSALAARRKGHLTLADTSLITQPRHSCLQPSHPWLDDMMALPPGKYRHLRMILNAHNQLDRPLNQWRCARLSPLLSQPIIELCLAIDTWHWCRGGIDRAPARRAFAGMIPESILQRRTKGTPSTHYAAVLLEHKAFLRSLLLTGLLADNGIVECNVIEKAIGDPQIFNNNGFLRLLGILDVEIWARSWTDRF